MSYRRVFCAIAISTALVVPVLPATAETTSHSGTIGAVDRAVGTIVLDEIGPWRVKGGATEITRRTITVTATTEFKLAERVRATGRGGGFWEFVEVALRPEELKTGDFVTVKVAHEGWRLTAVTVTLVRPGQR